MAPAVPVTEDLVLRFLSLRKNRRGFFFPRDEYSTLICETFHSQSGMIAENMLCNRMLQEKAPMLIFLLLKAR